MGVPDGEVALLCALLFWLDLKLSEWLIRSQHISFACIVTRIVKS